MKICNKTQAMALLGVVAGMCTHTTRAVLIDIDGRLADSTEACAMEWGDNSARKDSGTTTAVPVGTNKPDPVSDNDGTVKLTVAANIQDWRTGYTPSTITYEIGEEWNVRSSSTSTTAAGAFTQGAFFEITLDSTENASALFTWDAVSVSLWRNGTGADSHFQLAVDAGNDGFTVDDLVGTAATPAAGIGGATTISWSGVYGSSTTNTVRLYHWGNSSPSGNMHLYDVTAEYTVIPEPATLGLVAALGGGILLVRRRFMI